MQFTTFTQTTVNSLIYLKTTIPLEYVSKINYYIENNSGTFSKKEFRWSFDNNYWSSWATLTQSNFSNISVNNNLYIFIEIRYTPSITSSTVSGFTIDYNKDKNQENINVPNIIPINGKYIYFDKLPYNSSTY